MRISFWKKDPTGLKNNRGVITGVDIMTNLISGYAISSGGRIKTFGSLKI